MSSSTTTYVDADRRRVRDSMVGIPLSGHARARCQHRALPPLVLNWLHEFGHEHHDGHGGVILHFNKPARRRLERAVGREPVRRMKQWLNAYAVVSTDGQLITAGHRFRRIRRH